MSAAGGLTFSKACPGIRPFPQSAELKTLSSLQSVQLSQETQLHKKKRNGTQNPNVLTPLIIPFIML